MTVSVGSDISEPRRWPARARPTRSFIALIISSTVRRSASWMVGATSPPPRSEIATPRCTPDPGTNASSTQNPSGSARFPHGQRGRLEQEGCRDEPLAHREIAVAPLHPAPSRSQVDGRREVVVRDLPLRPRHEPADRFPHRVRTASRRLVCRARLGWDPRLRGGSGRPLGRGWSGRPRRGRGGRASDVVRTDDAVDVQAGQVDSEAPPRPVAGHTAWPACGGPHRRGPDGPARATSARATSVRATSAPPRPQATPRRPRRPRSLQRQPRPRRAGRPCE